MRLDKNILGIDFGTTNSKMAYILLDEPVMIENSEGKKMKRFSMTIMSWKIHDRFLKRKLQAAAYWK
jgi:molecular chaperone DnaK (HSP70)